MIYEEKNFLCSEKGARIKVLEAVDQSETKYIGLAQVSLPNGSALPLQFEISASNIDVAFENFEKAAEEELERMEKEAEEQQRLVDINGNAIGTGDAKGPDIIQFPS